MARMNAAEFEQAQSRMRLENTEAKGAVAERSATMPVTSDLMTLKEAAAYLRVSPTQLYARLNVGSC
jgi:hypothetical protein